MTPDHIFANLNNYFLLSCLFAEQGMWSQMPCMGGYHAGTRGPGLEQTSPQTPRSIHLYVNSYTFRIQNIYAEEYHEKKFFVCIKQWVLPSWSE